LAHPVQDIAMNETAQYSEVIQLKTKQAVRQCLNMLQFTVDRKIEQL